MTGLMFVGFLWQIMQGNMTSPLRKKKMVEGDASVCHWLMELQWIPQLIGCIQDSVPSLLQVSFFRCDVTTPKCAVIQRKLKKMDIFMFSQMLLYIYHVAQVLPRIVGGLYWHYWMTTWGLNSAILVTCYCLYLFTLCQCPKLIISSILASHNSWSEGTWWV